MTGTLFVYENIRVEPNRLVIHFDYRVDTDEKTFDLTESFTLPAPLPKNARIDRVLRALHIALGISYYKTFIPPRIEHGYSMGEDEAGFWNSVFKHGLGEFLYKNNLHAEQLAQFTACNGTINPATDDEPVPESTALLGIGGGKDSIVAGEILRELNITTQGFVLATGSNTGQAQAVADVMGVQLNAVERRLDPQIRDMNQLPGAYNGHVPISLIFALTGCLLASITESRYVIVANESSASIPHAQHDGEAINHQWSKSFEFERQFQEYVHANISKHIDYFSLIRPLSSIAVAKLFVRYPDYFEVFTSDNAHFKQDKTVDGTSRWSLDSPKSLSSFILLAPWLDDTTVQKIFGRNFLNEPSLKQLFASLIGASDTPVLDCVGTPEELGLCLGLLQQQERYADTALMIYLHEMNYQTESLDDVLQRSLKLSDEHVIPIELHTQIHNSLQEHLS